MKLEDAIDFNPTEKLAKNTYAKKIGMDKLSPFYKYIDSFEYEKYSGGAKFRNGDTIVARITPCLENGKTAYIDLLNDGEVAFGSTEFLVMRNKENVTIPEFVYYLSISPRFREKAISVMPGTSGRQRVQLEPLKEEKIYISSIRDQIKLVKILSAIDEKIKLNSKINNNLHDLAEQQFNGIYLKGSPKKLGELLVSISTGSRPKGGAQDCGVPSIGAEKIEKFGVYNYSSEKYISEEYYEKLKNGKLNSGDVLLYKDGAYTGKVSMCLNDFPHKKAAVNEHVFILNTKNNWAQNYLYFALYNKDNKEMIHRLACSKAAQPGLNQIELKSVEVNICAEKEIINFENSVKPIMKKISSNALENKKLVELRDTLLPKLMNGEIDLDNIEI